MIKYTANQYIEYSNNCHLFKIDLKNNTKSVITMHVRVIYFYHLLEN